MSDERPSSAVLILHHRDEGLDQPWGEGEELELYRAPDGRFFLDRTYTHIDADGPRRTAGWISGERALEVLTERGGGAFAALIAELKASLPPTPEEVILRRTGAASWRALEARGIDALLAGAELVARGRNDAEACLGLVREEWLYRIEAGVFVRRLLRDGSARPEHEPLDGPGAHEALLFMRGLPAEERARLTDDPAMLREVRRRAGISFPGQD